MFFRQYFRLGIYANWRERNKNKKNSRSSNQQKNSIEHFSNIRKKCHKNDLRVDYSKYFPIEETTRQSSHINSKLISPGTFHRQDRRGSEQISNIAFHWNS